MNDDNHQINMTSAAKARLIEMMRNGRGRRRWRRWQIGSACMNEHEVRATSSWENPSENVSTIGYCLQWAWELSDNVESHGEETCLVIRRADVCKKVRLWKEQPKNGRTGRYTFESSNTNRVFEFKGNTISSTVKGFASPFT